MKSALPLRWVRPHELLVDVGAKAGAGGQQQVAVLDDRWAGDDIVLPGDVVDVDLHDLEVGDRGAEMRADQRAEMAVEIMRRAVDLEGIRHIGDLDAFE